MLFTSKTHSVDSRPQKIKISALEGQFAYRQFCPFDLMQTYFKLRGKYYYTIDEPFFVLQGNTPVNQQMVRKVFVQAIINIGLDS